MSRVRNTWSQKLTAARPGGKKAENWDLYICVKIFQCCKKYLPEHAAPGVVVFEHVVHLVQLGLAVLRVVNLVMVGRISESRSKAQK